MRAYVRWALIAVTAAVIPALAHDIGARPQKEIEIRDELFELRIAARFMKEERYNEAIRLLEKLCSEYPEFDLAAEHLAICYVRTGRIERAVAFLEERLARNPAHFPFARDLGYAYLDLGERDKALEIWHGVLGNTPSDARYYGQIARLEMEAGLYEEAIETYRAGRVFEKLYKPYTLEIIRLERLLGRWEAAFGEAIALVASSEGVDMESVKLPAEIYEESGFDDRLFAIADSAASAAGPEKGSLHAARAALLLEAGKYDEAGRYVEEQQALPERELYAFINYLSAARRRKAEPGCAVFYRKALDTFLSRYPDSPVAPGVMLALAENLRDEGVSGDGEKLTRAVRTADEIVRHHWGMGYAERASLFKARLLLEDLNRPREALDALREVPFRTIECSREAEEIRMRALFRAGAWEEAEQSFEMLAAGRDSVTSAIGLYGTATVSFLRGDFEKAVGDLSAFAEACPWSPWANDALETAMLVKEALAEGRAPLEAYRAVFTLEAEGQVRAAVDSLEAFAVRYPWSVLYPRAVYKKAELDLRLGNESRAARDFEMFAEKFPLDRLAPRALEQLAGIAAAGKKEEALKLYERILRRYPDDPFLDRVRRRYIVLRQSMEAAGDER
jgi:tetratricopeptide (TPR) repeat protein